MARFEDPTQRPYKLPDLSTTLNIPLHDIRINCVFCKGELQEREVFDFAFKDLFIVYRDCTPYAACLKCISFYARVRELRYYRDSVYGETLEAETKTPLHELLIRCYRCLKPLCPTDKLKHITEKRRFHNIAGIYTGQCRGCRTRARHLRQQRQARSETLV